MLDLQESRLEPVELRAGSELAHEVLVPETGEADAEEVGQTAIAAPGDEIAADPGQDLGLVKAVVTPVGHRQQGLYGALDAEADGKYDEIEILLCGAPPQTLGDGRPRRYDEVLDTR